MHAQTPLVEVKVSPFRRFFGAGMVALSGALLVSTALNTPPHGWLLQAALWGLAALLLGSAQKLWRDTGRHLRLIGTRLEDSAGELVLDLADVESIERGHFSLRPSNGFSVQLRREVTPCWRMGLWWRAGRRAAFGGAASSAQVKPLAEAIERHLGLDQL
ncbi:hypothetical protein [uncultured Lentibacter sp.]|jgi:hypothetical protein|uniref:hypothetical protein n=1 Tax=uncultured Lentibacter sp. TaxID=1659309 RepID=UPI002613C54E|nr:hypothetical protein [uncultured Lentibacter sp.]